MQIKSDILPLTRKVSEGYFLMESHGGFNGNIEALVHQINEISGEEEGKHLINHFLLDFSLYFL